jgi:uncharacterized protein
MPEMRQAITIVKKKPDGKEVWRYPGEVLQIDPTKVVVEARFQRADLPFMGTVLREGDRFVEIYYFDRWYNIFEIHDREDDRVKGWYCNIARPAQMEATDRLNYVDLALDLWVTPQGKQTILDEDEFKELALDESTTIQAWDAMKELQKLFDEKKEPDLLQPGSFDS